MFDARLKNREDVSGCLAWQDWVRTPTTWVVLGSECLDLSERTMGVDLINRAKHATGDQNLGYSASITAAKAYASFQRMKEAIAYAEAALALKPLDPVAIELLSKWSPEHKREFKMILRMARKIQRNWRTRPWKQVYRDKIKKNYVETMEEKIGKNHFDALARNELVYYSKAKWRPVVLAEVTAAKRIQKAVKNHQSWNRWMKAKKERHIRKLAALYRKWRKYPYDMELRKLVFKLVAHKDTPKDHKIRELPILFQKEHECASKLQRQFYVWKARQFMKEIREVRALLRYEKEVASSVVIQCAWRQHVARQKLQELKDYERQCWESALLLQRIWRGRKQKWNFIQRMLAIRKEEERKRAELHLAMTVQRLWRGFVQRMNYTVVQGAVLDIQRVYRGSQGRKLAKRRKIMLICRIQRIWRSHVEWSRFKLLTTRMRLKKRRNSLNLGGRIVPHMIAEALPKEGTVKYSPPGVNRQSAAFQNLLQATTVVFSDDLSTDPVPEHPDPSTSFAAHDAILLSSVLRKQECEIQALLLRNADLSNDKGAHALTSALSSCRSLTCLGISNCDLSFDATVQLLETIRTQNFRIEKLILESNEYGFADEGALYAGKLISDYFHHQFGKFHHLSLSQNHISDIGAVKIGEGLLQNSMLLSLNLCDNFIDNAGAIAIAKALKDNSTLTALDLSDNRITSKGGAFLFEALFTNRTLVDLLLANNLMTDHGLEILPKSIMNNIVIRKVELCGNMLTATFEQELQNLFEERAQSIELPDLRSTGGNEDGFMSESQSSLSGSKSLPTLLSSTSTQNSQKKKKSNYQHSHTYQLEKLATFSYHQSSSNITQKVKKKKIPKKPRPDTSSYNITMHHMSEPR